MREKTTVYICILNGILMLINPIIGILLFMEGSSDILIIVAYSSLYAGFSLILGAILVREDYSPLGIDYLELGNNVLRIAIVVDIVSLVIFNILLATSIGEPIFLSIFEFFVYNIIEVITLIIAILIVKKFRVAIKTHDHGEQFSH
ncbi:MAG: hypothetical protein EU548_09125 [Promethearchaeota archaeon]|nr:MAG: hypothetical protein EU548_09125 [Candidatus Lokiarchaeota archaeon]